MGKINISKIKSANGKFTTRYSHILPKETMDRLHTQKGDKLLFLGENQGIISFKFERGDRG